MSFFEYIAQHPWVGVVLVLLIALTVFVWCKAIISGRKRNEERERIIADLEREKALRNEFRNVDEATFSEGKDNYRLVIGMCAHVQMKLEKADNMNEAFGELSELKKNVYSLGYVFEDSKKKLSEYFRSNGEPLTSQAQTAVKAGCFGIILPVAHEMHADFHKNYDYEIHHCAQSTPPHLPVVAQRHQKCFEQYAVENCAHPPFPVGKLMI